jgi:hypothetical protein
MCKVTAAKQTAFRSIQLTSCWKYQLFSIRGPWTRFHTYSVKSCTYQL